MHGPSRRQRLFPFTEWIGRYSSGHLKGDLYAGLIVAILLIPQGMAYAMLAGLPPVYGLYASIIPLLLYGLFGTSRHLAVGPVALISLLIIAGVGELAEIGSERFIHLAILTAFGTGLFQILMGLFRMGFIVNFLSRPVLTGFISAAALIIAISQLGSLTGINLPQTVYVHEILPEFLRSAGLANLPTTLIGTGSIAAILLLRQWKKTFPGVLTVVAAGILLTALLNLDEQGVSIVGAIPGGLPAFSLPGINTGDLQLLFPLILVISFVSYIESIAISKSVASRQGYRVDANQELVALGLSKLGGSLFQSYPTTGSFSRTAVNEQAGAQTGMASIFTAALVGLTVLMFTPLFHYLPHAILAGIIMVAVAGLFDVREMVNLWRTDKKDFSMLLATFLATLFFGIMEGIAVGVTLSLAVVIYSTARPHGAVLGRLGDTRTFRNLNRYPGASDEEGVLIYRFDSPLYFASVEYFQDTLENHIREKEETLELVVLDAAAISNIDSTGIHALKKFITSLHDRGISFYIAGVIGPVRDKLKAGNLMELIGKQHFFFDVDDALTWYKKHERKDSRFSPLQSNL